MVAAITVVAITVGITVGITATGITGTMDTILITADMGADTAIIGRGTATAAADMAMEAAIDAAPDTVTGATTTTAAVAVA